VILKLNSASVKISWKPTKYHGPLTVVLKPSCSGAVKKYDTIKVIKPTQIKVGIIGHIFLECSKVIILINIVRVAIW